MSEESVLIDLKNLKSPDPDMKWTAINNLSKYLKSNPADFRFRMILKSFLNNPYLTYLPARAKESSTKMTNTPKNE